MKLLPMLFFVLCLPQFARAQDLWVELTQGDLSNDRFAPTPLVLSPGDNYLYGVINGEDSMGNIDRDYFSISIPDGYELSQLVLDNYASTDFAAFMGIQPGPIFPDDPNTVGENDLMGWTLFGPPDISHDLLPLLASHGYGFKPPLSGRIYSFWVQQMGDFTEWNGVFVVTAIPEPGVAFLLLIAVASRRMHRARR